VIAMCQICFDFKLGKLTPEEALANLEEIKGLIPDHINQVINIISDNQKEFDWTIYFDYGSDYYI
jgi:hypothetical protein